MSEFVPLYVRLGVTQEEFDQRLASGWQVGKYQGRAVWIKPPAMYTQELDALAADQPVPAKKKRKRGRRG